MRKISIEYDNWDKDKPYRWCLVTYIIIGGFDYLGTRTIDSKSGRESTLDEAMDAAKNAWNTQR